MGGGGGSGGGGGGAAMTPVFLSDANTDSEWDYLAEVKVGGGGAAGIGGEYHPGSGGTSSVTILGYRVGFPVVSYTVATANGGSRGTTCVNTESLGGGSGGSASVATIADITASLYQYVPDGIKVRNGFSKSGAAGGGNGGGQGGSVGQYNTQAVDYGYMFNSKTRGGYSGGTVRDTGTRPGGSGGASPNGTGGASGKDREDGVSGSGYGPGGGGSSYKKPIIGTNYDNGGAGLAGRAWVWY